jgi:hypothetical protein
MTTAQHSSWLPGSTRALFVHIDQAHVRDGRWTPEVYAEDRRYRAQCYELGIETADAVEAGVEEAYSFGVECRKGDPWDGPDWSYLNVSGLPNLQFARLYYDGLEGDDWDEVDIYTVDRSPEQAADDHEHDLARHAAWADAEEPF